MKDEFQKKVLSKFEVIEKRLKNIEEKLKDMEDMMNAMYENIADEDYAGEGDSPMEHEGDNVTRMPSSHKNIEGYI